MLRLSLTALSVLGFVFALVSWMVISSSPLFIGLFFGAKAISILNTEAIFMKLLIGTGSFILGAICSILVIQSDKKILDFLFKPTGSAMDCLKYYNEAIKSSGKDFYKRFYNDYNGRIAREDSDNEYWKFLLKAQIERDTLEVDIDTIKQRYPSLKKDDQEPCFLAVIQEFDQEELGDEDEKRYLNPSTILKALRHPRQRS